MAFLTLEGIYRNGHLELKDPPPNSPTEGRVLVTFIPDSVEPVVSDESQDAGTDLSLIESGVPIAPTGAKFDRDELYAARLEELDERRARNGGHQPSGIRS